MGLEAPRHQTPCEWRVARVLRCTLDAVQTASSVQRPWGGEKAPDGVHGSRCEEAPFTLFAMNRARLADS